MEARDPTASWTTPTADLAKNGQMLDTVAEFSQTATLSTAKPPKPVTAAQPAARAGEQRPAAAGGGGADRPEGSAYQPRRPAGRRDARGADPVGEPGTRRAPRLGHRCAGRRRGA